MGQTNSNQNSKRKGPTKPLTDYPWRQPAKWNSELEKHLIENIEQINPPERPNLLISGPVGAGKSSFINAVLSIGAGTKVSRAQTGSSKSSFTVQYTGYTHKALLKRFILRDTMGIEPKDGTGIHVDDFICLINGQIKNNYKFNPANPISPGDNQFRQNPDFKDKTHCVIFIISAVDIDADIPDSYIRKISQLQDRLRVEGVPRVLILTKADLLCEKVNANISNMFKSTKIQRAVKTASEIFSIDQASIHPVVNYEVDFTLTPDNNIPLLLALRQSMQYASDFVEYALGDEIE